jgi:hypothetical protein
VTSFTAAGMHVLQSPIGFASTKCNISMSGDFCVRLRSKRRRRDSTIWKSTLGLVRLFPIHMDWMGLEKIEKKFDLFGIQTHPIPLNPHGLRANRTSP